MKSNKFTNWIFLQVENLSRVSCVFVEEKQFKKKRKSNRIVYNIVKWRRYRKRRKIYRQRVNWQRSIWNWQNVKSIWKRIKYLLFNKLKKLREIRSNIKVIRTYNSIEIQIKTLSWWLIKKVKRSWIDNFD